MYRTKQPDTKMLTEQDYINAANDLGCNVAAIKAVDDVESLGDGFLASGKLKILFEGHKFYKYVTDPEQVSKDYPTICFRVSTAETRKYYLGGEAEYKRFNQAFKIDPRAAMLSTSWGRYQIMGFNYQDAGYKSVDEMIDDYKLGEDKQLLSFCQFVKKVDLHKCLQGDKPDFAAFASGYNGKSYKINKYDIKLQASFNKFLV